MIYMKTICKLSALIELIDLSKLIAKKLKIVSQNFYVEHY